MFLSTYRHPLITTGTNNALRNPVNSRALSLVTITGRRLQRYRMIFYPPIYPPIAQAKSACVYNYLEISAPEDNDLARHIYSDGHFMLVLLRHLLRQLTSQDGAIATNRQETG